MSASTEKIIEQIQEMQQAIATAETAGMDTINLKVELQQLQCRLNVASKALTEGRQILKD